MALPGMTGMALFCGDAMFTPAISVLSAGAWNWLGRVSLPTCSTSASSFSLRCSRSRAVARSRSPRSRHSRHRRAACPSCFLCVTGAEALYAVDLSSIQQRIRAWL